MGDEPASFNSDRSGSCDEAGLSRAAPVDGAAPWIVLSGFHLLHPHPSVVSDASAYERRGRRQRAVSGLPVASRKSGTRFASPGPFVSLIEASKVCQTRHHASGIVTGDRGLRFCHLPAVSPSGEESRPALAGGFASVCPVARQPGRR